jgi:hypothetical protein
MQLLYFWKLLGLGFEPPPVPDRPSPALPSVLKIPRSLFSKPPNGLTLAGAEIVWGWLRSEY